VRLEAVAEPMLYPGEPDDLAAIGPRDADDQLRVVELVLAELARMDLEVALYQAPGDPLSGTHFYSRHPGPFDFQPKGDVDGGTKTGVDETASFERTCDLACELGAQEIRLALWGLHRGERTGCPVPGDAARAPTGATALVDLDHYAWALARNAEPRDEQPREADPALHGSASATRE
jgi:hypothetical protein